jgi:hypothetical protein
MRKFAVAFFSISLSERFANEELANLTANFLLLISSDLHDVHGFRRRRFGLDAQQAREILAED